MKAVVADGLNSYSVRGCRSRAARDGRGAGADGGGRRVSLRLSIPFPTVLGHEGAGVEEEVGEGVTNVSPGDHVILSFIPHCGECFHCVRDEPYLCNVAKQDGNLLDGTTRVSRAGEPVFVMSFLGNSVNASHPLQRRTILGAV